ncbi:Lamin tail domain containing protein [Spirosomataceae bacterium]
MNFKLFALLFYLSVSASAQSHEIIITEIFADPTPSKGLPEREYIEIYNSTEKDISLKNYQLFYGNFKTTFPDFLLKANVYAIVCRKGFEQEFSTFGPVVVLSSFSLSNEGSLLVIKDAKNQDITFVEYAADWHTEANTGGVSLEMIDLNYPCVGKVNWASAKAQLGGSPGTINSVASTKPDVSPPVLINSSLNLKEIVLNFDENLSLEFLKEKNNFLIENSPNHISQVFYKPYNHTQVILTLKDPIEIGETLNLRVLNLKDCSGNLTEDLDIEFSNLLPAVNGEILISEILFNPKPGGEDFVELYNASDKTLNLKNWKLARLDALGQMDDITQLVTYDLLLKPKEYVAFTKNKKFLLTEYPKSGDIVEVTKMPAFNNESGTVVVINDKEEVFERFTYNEKDHHELLTNPEGVSLERTNLGAVKANWTSASFDYGFATPGSENSQKLRDDLQNVFFADPIVFNPYQLNELATTKLKYQLNTAGVAASIDVVNRNGYAVKTLANNVILGSSGEIDWDGKDNNGQLLPVGYYVFRINIYSEKLHKSFLAKCVIGSN